MSGKKINPAFVILSVVGILIIAFALFGSFVTGTKVDDADADKNELSLQLATMLNFTVAGLALILAGVGFQLTAGPKAPLALGGQAPGHPYGQPGQQQYQAQPQYQAPPQAGQQWGQHPPAQG